MNMHILEGFIKIVRAAIEDPTDRAAATIAIDGIEVWADIANNPKVLKLEADIGAYVATLPKGDIPVPPAPVDTPPSPQPTQSPSDFNRWQAEHPPT